LVIRSIPDNLIHMPVIKPPPVLTFPVLVWLAGWLEGEGSFICSGTTTKDMCFQIRGVSTDLDVIERVATALKVDVGGPFYDKRPNRKPLYYANLPGKRARDLMLQLYPLMGNRRQRQISDAITKYDSRFESKD